MNISISDSSSDSPSSQSQELDAATPLSLIQTLREHNRGETDIAIGQRRLDVLRPYALARLGRPYELWDQASNAIVAKSGPLPIRPVVDELSRQLGCGTDYIFELVKLMVRVGPENVRASDMLIKPQGGGKGVSRLEANLSQALDQAIETVCVDQGMTPGTAAATKAIRNRLKAAGYEGKLPSNGAIRRRSCTPEVTLKRADPYKRDHLYRVCELTNIPCGLMSMAQLDATQCSDEEGSLWVVDGKGRPAGVANVIFGILPSTRGVWTWLPFVGAANSYLSGLAIKRGMYSKHELLKGWKIEGHFPFAGKPASIRHDNGSEFINKHLNGVLRDYQIAIVDRSPPETPHYRGILERFNRTAHVLFKAFLESDIGKRYIRPVYKKPGAMGITLADLDRALAEWIVSDYHVRPHAGLGGETPLRRFEKYVQGEPGYACSGLPMPVGKTEDVDWDFMWEDARTVNHTGISLHNRRYSCAALSLLFAVETRSSGKRIPVRFNPYKMDEIYMKLPDGEGGHKIISIPWVREWEKLNLDEDDRQASVNPSFWEWKVLFSLSRQAGKLKPTSGILEEMHATREAQAVAVSPIPGAPPPKSRMRDTKNREMRNHYGLAPTALSLMTDKQETAPGAEVDQPKTATSPSPAPRRLLRIRMVA